MFWTTNCPDCWKALRGCRDLASKVADRKVKVLGVNFDTEKLATVRSMIKGEKIDFINLSDFQGKVAALFQTESYDFSSFIVDRKGILRHVGYDHPPDVEKILLQKVNTILGNGEGGKSQEKLKDVKGDKDRKA
ncbi:MAG: TlpA family protein disulfide reductase [Geobacter sp.]|nr:MAG: TlpA family protein disulfide reductase [Geobacter sp.]